MFKSKNTIFQSEALQKCVLFLVPWEVNIELNLKMFLIY